MVKQERKNNMKRKSRRFGVGLAIATMLTSIANATMVVYNWVPDAINPLTSQPSLPSSGTLQFDTETGVLYDFSITFTLEGGTTETTFGNFDGTISLLGVNLQLNGTSSGDYAANWTPYATSPGPDENWVSLSADPDYYGDWVPETPVPEPTTMLAGALLLLPFGASTLRMLRKGRAT
jgi:hypothetical protein